MQQYLSYLERAPLCILLFNSFKKFCLHINSSTESSRDTARGSCSTFQLLLLLLLLLRLLLLLLCRMSAAGITQNKRSLSGLSFDTCNLYIHLLLLLLLLLQ